MAAFLVRLLVLYVPFSVACIVAVPLAFLRLVSGWEYATNLFTAMDRVLAAVLGKTGEYTVSAECGRDVTFLPWIRTLLNTIETDHCKKAWERESRLRPSN